MQEFSILIGGKAGDGIKQAGTTAAKMFAGLGYYIFLYDDYPSLIRGGHNFSIIRVSKEPIYSHRDKVNLIVALNRETIDRHKDKLLPGGVILFDSKIEDFDQGISVPFTKIVKESKGIPIMRNSAALGAIAKVAGLSREFMKDIVGKSVNRSIKLNLKIAELAYNHVGPAVFPLKRAANAPMPIFSGNEAIALGAASAGLKLYIAYPMTPATSILHFIAENEDRLGVVSVHPENEISAALMALGGASAGARTMVGSSGGGFALMAESVSFAGQSEIPILFVECQRAGPGTGVPTYTMQADLSFVLSVGHGDFPRLVVAPGDVQEAFDWASIALDMAWHFQIPAFLLSDKHLSESLYSFTLPEKEPARLMPVLHQGDAPYKRYLNTESGISPLAFPGQQKAIVKNTSYEHDEYGITTEEPEKIAFMQEKRIKKEKGIKKHLKLYQQVKVYGNPDAETAVACWGSTKGACIEAAMDLGLKVIQPLVMEPFPKEAFKKSLNSTSQLICAEVNATGQLSRLLSQHGISVHSKILRYDGLPFTPDDLKTRLQEVLR